MDQKRLFMAIGISIAILLGFQLLLPKPPPKPVELTQVTPNNAAISSAANTKPGADPASAATPAAYLQRDVPRMRIAAPRVQGSVNLVGARLDDLVLRDYREQVARDSPLVRLLEPQVDPLPYYVQFGWTAEGDVPVPGPNTLWKASAPELTNATPVTLSWDNGAGQTFEIVLSIDDNYMFAAEQNVRNKGPAPVKLFPGPASAATTPRPPPATTSCMKACWASSAAVSRNKPMTPPNPRPRSAPTASRSKWPAPAAGPASPINTG